MDEKKNIDLKKYASPKASRKYLIRFAVYAAIISGLILFVYFMRSNTSKKESFNQKKNYEKVEEIKDFTIDTL